LHKHLIAWAFALGLWPVAAMGLDATRPFDGLIHRRWDVDEGLPNSAVRALAETPDGLLWVGTRSGLARFDGRTFEIIAQPSISGLVVDDQGVLWAGTESAGVLRYHAGQLRSFGVYDGLASATVTAIALDPLGRLLVATSGGGVALREGALFTPLIRAVELPGPVVAIEAQGDRLWLATSKQLFVQQGGKLSAIATGSLPALHLRALSSGKDGDEMYVATDRGLFTLRDGGLVDPFAGQGPKEILALQADAGGSLWLGTFDSVWRSDPRQGRLERFSPPHPAAGAVVASLLLDRRGNLWIGSLDAGLHQLRENPLQTWGRREGLAADLVTSVAEDEDGGIWMTSRQGGLARLDLRTGQVVQVPLGRPGEDLWSLAIGAQGSLWLGTNYQGLLHRLPDGSWQSFGRDLGLPEGPVQAVRISRDGAAWAATDVGLGRVVDNRLSVFTKADGLPSNAIRDIFEDREGTLWIATTGGLARYLGNERFEAFTAGPLVPEGVLSIWQDGDGALWLATLGALVQIEKGRARALTTLDGLYCDDLSCAIGDRSGYLWMGTAKGLVRVSLAELRLRLSGQAIELHQWVFDSRSGLRAGISNNGTATLASRSGRLYFGSRGGLVAVDPEQLEPLPAPPSRLEEVRLTPRPWFKSLSSATSGSHLLFRFSASTLAAADDLHLRYRLAGFDSAWRSAGKSNVVEYNLVPPGTYRLQLQSSDQEGRFVGTEASTAWVVVEPRWGIALALLFFFLSLSVGALTLLHRLRIRWLERREASLQQQVDRALAELEVIRGMLPICSYCKKIRDDQGYWEEMESFFYSYSRLEFERGVCPDCTKRHEDHRQSSGRVIRIARAIPGDAP